MRRTVATLLVVASPLLLATPVSAGEDRLAQPGAPESVQALTPTVQAPAPAPATVAPALPAAVTPPAIPAQAPAPVRHVVRTVRAKAPASADLTDAAYTAKLQAELCQARQIFCGLDRNGRYPAG